MGKEPYRQNNLISAGESIVAAVSHQIGAKWRAGKERKKLANLHGYFGIMQELRADIPLTVMEDVTPIPEAPTVEITAVNAQTSEWLREQLRRIQFSKLPTRPLPEAQVPIHRRTTQKLPVVQTEQWYSIKPEILGRVKTRPLDQDQHTVKPRLSLKMKPGA